jgi:hypothetical protein
MSWVGGWLGGSSSGGSGGGSSSPALGIETTVEAIRDRAIDVIAALIPRSLASDHYHAYRNEKAAQFKIDVEKDPVGKWRWFQVVDDGDDPPPEVSNADFDEKKVTLIITIAYPQDHRAGPEAGLDRADVMKQDQRQVEAAVGLYGRANFAPPHPDACWQSGKTKRTVGNGVDYIEITQTMTFRCDVR